MKHSIIRKTEEYTEHTKAYFRLPNTTTMETLITRLTTTEGAVLKKGERILVADRGRGGFLAGVYEMVWCITKCRRCILNFTPTVKIP